MRPEHASHDTRAPVSECPTPMSSARYVRLGPALQQTFEIRPETRSLGRGLQRLDNSSRQAIVIGRAGDSDLGDGIALQIDNEFAAQCDLAALLRDWRRRPLPCAGARRFERRGLNLQCLSESGFV